MRCSDGNLDAVAASGTPNPRKEATPDTPAVCAVNEPADQWRQSAWPDIRWTGFPKAKPAAAARIRVRLSSATHHGGNASRRRRNRSATAAQVLQGGTARSHQKEPANVVSTRGWQNSQLCTAAAAGVLASESRAYRRVGARLSTRAPRSWLPGSRGYGPADERPADRIFQPVAQTPCRGQIGDLGTQVRVRDRSPGRS
jgi:hypothetical protein